MDVEVEEATYWEVWYYFVREYAVAFSVFWIAVLVEGSFLVTEAIEDIFPFVVGVRGVKKITEVYGDRPRFAVNYQAKFCYR